jgi:probable rRNA maturation factor
VQYALDEINVDGANVNKMLPPPATDFRKWANAALAGKKEDAQLTIRVVNEKESTYLNERYRHKNGPTNVLSFPAEYAEDIPVSHIGDIVICSAIVFNEAKAQNKAPNAHWAHLTVHGTLHLLGYDHTNEQDANKMETCEINILKQIGFTNPYAQRTPD